MATEAADEQQTLETLLSAAGEEREAVAGETGGEGAAPGEAEDPAAGEDDFLSKLERLEQEAVALTEAAVVVESASSFATPSVSAPSGPSVSAPSSASAAAGGVSSKTAQLGSGARLFARDRPLEWRVFCAENYSFNESPALSGKFDTAPDSLRRRQEAYLRRGARQSVAAAILVHRLHFPHLLLFQPQAGRGRPALLSFKWRSWERAPEALEKKLKNVILPQPERTRRSLQLQPSETAFQVGAFLGEWWRPEVDLDFTPFLPPHVSRPKERMRVFQVELSAFCTLRIPPGASLTAVPLFALTPERVGLCLSGLTFVLSLFNVKMMFAATGKELDLDALDSQEEEETEGAVSQVKHEEEAVVANAGTAAPHADDGKLPPELQRLADLEELH